VYADEHIYDKLQRRLRATIVGVRGETRDYRRYDKHSAILSEGREEKSKTRQQKDKRSIDLHSGGEVSTLDPAFWATATAAPATSTTPGGLLNIVLGVGTWWGEQHLGS